MKASQVIIDKIALWEGCRLTAYSCPAGVLTIGYGHTGADVRPGMTISREEALRLLQTDVDAVARQVAQLTAGTVLTQRQFDALVSLAFNIGTGALKTSTLLRKVKANPADPSIAGEFRRWVYAGGRVLPGLVTRRQAEADHYFNLN